MVRSDKNNSFVFTVIVIIVMTICTIEAYFGITKLIDLKCALDEKHRANQEIYNEIYGVNKFSLKGHIDEN